MNQTLTALDIFGKPHTALSSNFKLRISAYGVLVENGNILLQQNPVNKKYNLPGGAIEIGESERDAVSREFLEETGYSVKATEVIDTDFQLFTLNNIFFHNIILFYKVVRTSDSILPINCPENDSSDAKFFNINTLDYDTIQPIYYKILKSLCH